MDLYSRLWITDTLSLGSLYGKWCLFWRLYIQLYHSYPNGLLLNLRFPPMGWNLKGLLWNIFQPRYLEWNPDSILGLFLYSRVSKYWITVSSLGDVEDYVVVGSLVEYEGPFGIWYFYPFGLLMVYLKVSMYLYRKKITITPLWILARL